MLSKHEDQELRRETLDNDRHVLEGTTFHQFGNSDANVDRGRFTAHDTSTVIGATPSPATAYPQGPAWSTADQGLEPPFPIDISATEPVGEKFEIARSVRPLGSRSLPEETQATSSVVPLAEHGDPTVHAPTPGAVGSPLFRPKTFRRF